MTTINASVLSLYDWAKRLDPEGNTASIVELLSQSNAIIQDMPWVQGNLPTGHRTVVRTGLPSVGWRLLNNGIAPSKSLSNQFDEACGMLEAYSEVDVDLCKLNGNEAEFRLSEAAAFIEAMNQEFAQTLFYGNVGTAPEEFNGLATRYSSRSATVPSSSNILSGAGAQSDNSSVWLVAWGPNTVHGIFPKGSMAGLQHKNLGEVTIESAAGMGQGNRMQAYRDHWQWKCGIAVRDWRYCVRIANIDISNLVAKSSAADLIELMIMAIHRMPNPDVGRKVFYMNRTCFEMLDIQRRDDVITGGGLVYSDVDGKIVPTFRGIPIRKVDQLIEAEAVVS